MSSIYKYYHVSAWSWWNFLFPPGSYLLQGGICDWCQYQMRGLVGFIRIMRQTPTLNHSACPPPWPLFNINKTWYYPYVVWLQVNRRKGPPLWLVDILIKQAVCISFSPCRVTVFKNETINSTSVGVHISYILVAATVFCYPKPYGVKAVSFRQKRKVLPYLWGGTNSLQGYKFLKKNIV